MLKISPSQFWALEPELFWAAYQAWVASQGAELKGDVTPMLREESLALMEQYGNF